MKSFVIPSLLVLLAAVGPSAARAGSCSPLPPIDPTKGFVANFSNACYVLALKTGNGSGESGDLNALYSEVYYQVTPGYEIIILGTYPHARFMMATVYDDHLYPVSNLLDTQILPMASNMINPLAPNTTFKPYQRYGLTVSFGGGKPTSVSPGCSTASTTIDENVLDASQIHQGVTWLGFPNLPPGFPVHETGANASGVISVRKYIDIDNPPVPEYAVVRSLATGCAVPIAQAIQKNIISATMNVNSAWLHQAQIAAHNTFVTSIEPWECFPNDPNNDIVWMRVSEYIPLLDIQAGYLNAKISPTQIQNLMSGQTYMRLQFQLPTTPTIPCAAGGGCTFTGNEQTRYFGLSFQAPGTTLAGPSTFYSVDDQNLVKDPNGNVTVVVGFGAPRPANVTAANYYTWIDMSGVPNSSNLIAVRIRDLDPNSTFQCSSFNVPNRTTEYNDVGGYTGPYVPTVDFPTASQILVLPTPPNRPNSCSAVPVTMPQACTQYPIE